MAPYMKLKQTPDGQQATVVSVIGASGYQAVPASQTNAVLGTTGAKGDYLEGLLCVVSTAATSQVTISDGGTSIVVLPNSPGQGVGSYYLPINAYSVNSAWKITTGAGVAVLATGSFT